MIDVQAKYGITLKPATGLSNTEPSSLAIMYAPPLLCDNNEGSKVASSHLPIKCLLDCSIPNENEIAGFEVVVMNCVSMILFKLNGCLQARCVNLPMKLCQMLPSFLQCDHSSCNEVGH